MNMTKKAAKLINGGLSNTSKMACKSYGLPAKECTTGSKLRKIEGSVCSDCYALKGMYFFPVVQAAQYKRLASITSPEWVESMVASIGKDLFFRWHDSGDLQSVEHLEKIIEVCNLTPNTRHWLPTKEKRLVSKWLKNNTCPDNLIIRLSAPMLNQAIKVSSPDLYTPSTDLYTSSVHTSDLMAIGFKCNAPNQNGECRDCRACWSKSVLNVSYHKH